MQEDKTQLVVERLGVGLGGEVAALLGPLQDAVGDAADELLDAVFALQGADLAPEVFGNDDVGGELRPVLGDLDAVLLEDDGAVAADDAGVAKLPLDGVPDVMAGLGVAARDRESGGVRFDTFWSAVLQRGGHLGRGGLDGDGGGHGFFFYFYLLF